MSITTFNLDDPPPECAPHQELIEHARERIMGVLAEHGPNLDLTDLLAVIVEPKYARATGKHSVYVLPLRRAMGRLFHLDEQREALRQSPAPGFMHAALYTAHDVMLVQMRVRPACIPPVK